MKFILLSAIYFISFSAIAMNITCTTDTQYGDPLFSLSAEISDDYVNGSELLELKNVEISAFQRNLSLEIIKKDGDFKPKKNDNLTQFLFSLFTMDERFAGDLIAMRFTKNLEPHQVVKKEDGTYEFGALLIGKRYGENHLSSFLLDCITK